MGKKLDVIGGISWIVGVLVAIAVGGLFINGTFLSVVILKWLPLIVHQVVGWLIVGSTILGLVLAAYKKFF